jgi:hypothetical protein
MSEGGRRRTLREAKRPADHDEVEAQRVEDERGELQPLPVHAAHLRPASILPASQLRACKTGGSALETRGRPGAQASERGGAVSTAFLTRRRTMQPEAAPSGWRGARKMAVGSASEHSHLPSAIDPQAYY